MTRILTSLALAAMAFAVAPQAALAEEVPFQASFAVAASATFNAGSVAYCGGPAYDVIVEAHGDGFSSLGALSLTLFKTLQFGGGPMHGCLTLTAPNGDSLFATYDGTEGSPNANNFIVDAKGTLTFTGGTGRFKGAKGKATFTAVFGLPGVSAPPNVTAFYLVQGKVSVGGLD
jgi:hypothetical protein